MIEHPSFSVEPWALRETELLLDVLAQAGSVFALANGHIGLRGNLDEGEPLEIAHHGEMFDVTGAEAVSRPIPPTAALDLQAQPPGRAPARRRPSG